MPGHSINIKLKNGTQLYSSHIILKDVSYIIILASGGIFGDVISIIEPSIICSYVELSGQSAHVLHWCVHTIWNLRWIPAKSKSLVIFLKVW